MRTKTPRVGAAHPGDVCCTKCLEKGLCKHRHRSDFTLLDTFRASPHFVCMHCSLLLGGRFAAHLTRCGGTGPAAEGFELVLVLGSSIRIQELRWSLSAGDTSRVLATATLQALVVTIRDFLLHGDAVGVDGPQLLQPDSPGDYGGTSRCWCLHLGLLF